MTRDQKTYRLAYWMASFILAAVLLSGTHKILYPADFALAVYRFHLLPGFLVNTGALYIEWLELICAFCLLLVPRYRVAALWIVLVLLALFTGGIIINLLRGTTLSCGCFNASPLARPMDWMNVVRNMGLIVLVLLALEGRRRADQPYSSV